MAARTTMAGLIQRVRGLTGAGTAEYVAGSETFWSDQHIQDALDMRRRDYLHEPLYAVQTYSVAGSAVYMQYRAPVGFWEASTGGTAVMLIQDGVGAAVGTASYSFDALTGVVTFTGNQSGSARAITGAAYDVYGAAADLMESWAARESRAFDYSGDGQSLHRSQKAEMLREQVDRFRAMAWVVSVPAARSDLPSRWDRWD